MPPHGSRSMALMRREVILSVLALLFSSLLLTSWASIIRYTLYAFLAGLVVGAIVLASISLFSARAKKIAFSRAGFKPTIALWGFHQPISKLGLSSGKAELSPKQSVISDKVSTSLDELLERLSNAFVYSWYRNISSSSNFSDQIVSLLKTSLTECLSRVRGPDIVECIVSRMIPIITDHLHEFHEAEHLVRGKKLNRSVTESEELDLAIAAKYKNGKLHPAASLAFSDTRIVQQDYVRKVVVRLMPQLLPSGMLRSRAVSVLVKEIASCAVLAPTMQMLCDPDFWNQAVEAYGRSMLQDRKTVRKLRAALDEHASPVPKASKSPTVPKLSPHDDERSFERFVRAIRRCNNLSEARRFRSEMASQLKRESMLEGQDQIYLRRLETGKRILDQRVATLSNVRGAIKPAGNTPGSHNPAASSLTNATLREILHDAAGLSYFMEFMDRQHLMTLVQFWIVVEGIRNPLEDDVDEETATLHASTPWTESDRQDIAQISDAYLSKPEIVISADSKDAVRSFLKSGRVATPSQYDRARNAILRSQNSVLEKLQQEYLPGFRQSDLYYKLLTSDNGSGTSIVRQTSRSAGAPIAPAPQKAFGPEKVASITSQPNEPGLGLSRNSSSYSDLKKTGSGLDSTSEVSRRSFDVGASRPLFEDDVKPESSLRPADNRDTDFSSYDDENGTQDQMVEAMEAALTQIISGPEESRELYSDAREQDNSLEKDIEAARGLDEYRRLDTAHDGTRERPNLTSLGLVSTSSRIGVFKDDNLFEDEERFLEDEHADLDDQSDKRDREDEIHEAEPGDLGLAEAISALTIDIDRLVAQDSIVDTLVKKAELTNNVAELRILTKSKSSLQRELRRKELQRQQYIVQESDNSLYGKALVRIKSIVAGKEDDGQEFAVYVIEVQRRAGEHMPSATWAVARRYSEFHELHQRLRHLYPAVRQLEFPRRRLVMKLQRDFLDKRRVSLESYLRQLLLLPAVCRSHDLRAFLSHRPIMSTKEAKRHGDRADIVSRIYNSVTDGMDEFLGNIPVLDQLSIAGQNLISAAASQYQGNITSSAARETGTSNVVATDEEQAELDAFENQALEPFVKPICDLFLEAFELNRSQNWLRGRATVVVLHQLLGGTVERRVREASNALISDASLLKYISAIRDSMPTSSDPRAERKPRSPADRNVSRREASLVFATLVPDLAGSIVGRSNAQAAGRRIFATFNNARLNTHLAFRLLDEFVAILFNDRAKGKS